MPRRILGILIAVSACATGANGPAPRPGAPPPEPAPGWCSAVDAVLTGKETRGLRCLSVPNFLVTGFFGPEENPERSDFVNACFAGEGDAATRLRMNVRPVGDLGFRHASRQKLARSGGLDLGFLGPWAPKLRVGASDATELDVEVVLEDAEMRVLPSVAEILGQELAAAPEGSPRGQSLEACIGSVCSGREKLVYTAKVLAAVPVITLTSKSERARSLSISQAATGFELDEKKSTRSTLTLRAKEKLNIAALVEPAGAAFESAGTCLRARATLARREVLSGLRDIGLRTLSGRALEDIPKLAAPLRSTAERTNGAFSENERSTLVQSIEAIEGAARQLALAKPNNSLCANRSLAATVLTGSSPDNSFRSALVDVLSPVHERLTELANDNALPCADPVWYRDLDRDGYGDRGVSARASKQPPGYVANALDCYDQNPEAHPGQTRYYEQHRGDGSFDFDCDGKASKKEELSSGGCRSSTILGIPTKCWADAGWKGASPGCGEQGRWLAECEISTLSCEPSQEQRTVQTCH
ncbi:MAG: hypothetical protein HS104_37715 [Polyangiaceae bacterium]|nr:hypothetical protein [Polyangiaceae bacterium]MCE7893180.1 hypothetical protein [Sorangiineae bacterium PRO1]MCL4749930.1 hypothetical protein [Myxococcales bacterium]